MSESVSYLKSELVNASDSLLDRLWKSGVRSKGDIVDVLQSNPEGRESLTSYLEVSDSELLRTLNLKHFPEHSGSLLSLPFGLGALAPPESTVQKLSLIHI